MSENSHNAKAAEAAPATSVDDASADRRVVRKRRGSHRHRRSSSRKGFLGNMESERFAQKLLNFKVISFVLPAILLAVGGVILTFATSNPDASMHPKSMVQLARTMLYIGGVILAVALAIDWGRRFIVYQTDRREKAQTAAASGRRRSSHHRRRHHRDELDSE